MLIDLANDRIGTLRAIGRTDDQLALRLALGRTLDRVSLQPSGVPAGAILCVRQIRFRPGSGSAEGGQGVQGRNSLCWNPERWTTAIAQRMEALAREAVRPFGDSVPDDARAVLFIDEAELLACLARDWRRGTSQGWWWRTIFGHTLNDALVRRTLLSSPTLIPAVVQRLTRAQCLTPVVRAMPEWFCEQLGAAVASIFAVREWTTTATNAVADRGAGETNPTAANAPADVKPRIAVVLRQYASVEFAVLLPAQRVLVGLSLLIAAAPAVARSAGVVAALRSNEPWWTSSDVAPKSAAIRRRSEKSELGFRPQLTADSITPGSTEPQGRDEAPVLASAAPPLESPQTEFATPSETEGLAQSFTAVDVDTQADCLDDALPALLIVDSAFAGIVYLVNLALHLELYGDFTEPARPGLDLPVADFLALVGQRVLGDGFVADPVWGLLAALGGREPFEAPGSEFGGGRRDLARRVEEWTSQLADCAACLLGMEASAVLPFLCARAGRLALSSARLDATFELAAHPLAIRMACLDRDPGWVPAAGRTIAFHYE